MAKAMDKNTTQQLKKTKVIKEQWTSFLRIEHGNIIDKICMNISVYVHYQFLFYRTGGLLPGCWSSYFALLCNNKDQDHRRLGGCVQSTKWLTWNPKPDCRPGNLYRHHPEELHYSSPQNCQNRKAICPLHVNLLHSALGIISDQNSLLN